MEEKVEAWDFLGLVAVTVDVLDGLGESAGTPHGSLLDDWLGSLLVLVTWDLASHEAY